MSKSILEKIENNITDKVEKIFLLSLSVLLGVFALLFAVRMCLLYGGGGDKRALDLERWLNDDILLRFSDRILPVDKSVALEWGRICGEGERIGHSRAAIDALIAATARVHGMTLVTRNINDMVGMDVPLLNPFDQ